MRDCCPLGYLLLYVDANLVTSVMFSINSYNITEKSYHQERQRVDCQRFVVNLDAMHDLLREITECWNDRA